MADYLTIEEAAALAGLTVQTLLLSLAHGHYVRLAGSVRQRAYPPAKPTVVAVKRPGAPECLVETSVGVKRITHVESASFEAWMAMVARNELARMHAQKCPVCGAVLQRWYPGPERVLAGSPSYWCPTCEKPVVLSL